MDATDTELAEIALRFRRECLGWVDAFIDNGIITESRDAGEDVGDMVPESLRDIKAAVTHFLGTRYWIQATRGLNSDFKWMVAVGEQNQQLKGACREQAIAVNEDLGHAMLEARVKANKMGKAP